MRNCEFCSKAFEARSPKVRFCSLACAQKSRIKATKLRCSFCSKEFMRKTSKLSCSRSGFYFCSRSCKDKAQRIGGVREIHPDHYGEHLQDYREAMKRAGRMLRCEVCGYHRVPEILEVHHKDRDHSNNDPSNLVAICPNCHSEDHFLDKTGRFS